MHDSSWRTRVLWEEPNNLNELRERYTLQYKSNGVFFVLDYNGMPPSAKKSTTITDAVYAALDTVFSDVPLAGVPKTFGDKMFTLARKQQFRELAEAEVVELQYCASHWKLYRIGKNIFSYWRTTLVAARGPTIKVEPDSAEPDANSAVDASTLIGPDEQPKRKGGRGGKRARPSTASDETPKKRAKAINVGK